MTYYDDRKQADEKRFSAAYDQIVALTKTTEYPFELSRQFADFKVGRTSLLRGVTEVPADAVCKVRILTDFRGESFSCFVTFGKPMPQEVDSYFRKQVFFSANDAYVFMKNMAAEINGFFNKFS